MDTLKADSEVKAKALEMHAARLERRVSELESDMEQLKIYMLKLVSHQTTLEQKVNTWPYVVVKEKKE